MTEVKIERNAPIDPEKPIVVRACTGIGGLKRGHVVVAWQGSNELGNYLNLKAVRQNFGGNMEILDHTNSDTLCDSCEAKLRQK